MLIHCANINVFHAHSLQCRRFEDEWKGDFWKICKHKHVNNILQKHKNICSNVEIFYAQVVCVCAERNAS